MPPPEGDHHRLDDVIEDLRLDVERRPGPEPRQLEEVLDDPHQALGFLADVADHVPFRGAEVAVLAEDDGVPEDRRHRRPELVGDEAEELILDRVRRLQGGGRRAQRLFRGEALGDVDQDVHGTDELPVRIAQGRRVRHERDASAIGSLGVRGGAADGPILLEGDRHRALAVGHRPAVEMEQAERAAPLLAELRPATPEVDRGLVEVRDPPVRIGRVDRDPERLQEGPIGLLVSGKRQRPEQPGEAGAGIGLAEGIERRGWCSNGQGHRSAIITRISCARRYKYVEKRGVPQPSGAWIAAMSSSSSSILRRSRTTSSSIESRADSLP